MSEWRPIETAPRDETAIWLLVDGWPYLGYGEKADWLHPEDRWFLKASFRRRSVRDGKADEIFGTYAYDVKPTHWMPLPEPPKCD